MKRIGITKLLFIISMFLLLAGYGSSGSNTSNGSSNWDSMKWDQDNWG